MKKSEAIRIIDNEPHRLECNVEYDARDGRWQHHEQHIMLDGEVVYSYGWTEDDDWYGYGSAGEEDGELTFIDLLSQWVNSLED